MDPETGVLRNKLSIKDRDRLDKFERRAVQLRMEEGVPQGNFDLKHLKAIHRHLFQDVYDWAGELRTVNISKGGSAFQPLQFLNQGVDYVHKEIVKSNFLRGLSADRFADRAATIIGDLNYAHPFREGNGRTQFAFLAQLAEKAGHRIDVDHVPNQEWIEASKRAFNNDPSMMAKLIRDMVSRPPAQEVEIDRGSRAGGRKSLLDHLNDEASTLPNAVAAKRSLKKYGRDPTD
jgi:cell filamentation protein